MPTKPYLKPSERRARREAREAERKKSKVGGKRPGAGRPKGIKNRFSQQALEKAAEEGYLPLDYMLRVMRDARAQKPRRDAMAIAAAPYLHHKLSAIEVSGKKGQPLVLVTHKMTPQQAAEAFASTMVHDLDDSEYEVLGETKILERKK